MTTMLAHRAAPPLLAGFQQAAFPGIDGFLKEAARRGV